MSRIGYMTYSDAEHLGDAIQEGLDDIFRYGPRPPWKSEIETDDRLMNELETCRNLYMARHDCDFGLHSILTTAVGSYRRDLEERLGRRVGIVRQPYCILYLQWARSHR